MHPCPGNWVAIGHAVVYYAQAAHTFSAGIECLYCMKHIFQWYAYFVFIEPEGEYKVLLPGRSWWLSRSGL